MDRSDVLALVTETNVQDDYGVWRKSTTESTVYCQVESVTRQEFYDAGRNGLNPEYKFVIFVGDYAGQRTVKYNGDYYAVYRTYLAKNDNLELYVERQGGTNGEGDN